MSKDPKTNPPPDGKSQESLEDLVYRSSLAGNSKQLKGASPVVSIPVTIITYGLFGFLAVTVAKHTETGKKVIKTMGINLQEQSEEAPPPPPPPPPAPAAPAAPAPKVVQKEAPPPPPIDPRQDVVPEVAPRELPKTDRSMAYAGASSGSGSGIPGAGVAGAAPAGSGAMAVAGAGSSGRVVDFDFSQMKVKYQPPPPPYPPLAKLARIQGTVVVEIQVGTDGIPVSAHAIEGPPQLRGASEAYAMAWKFEPAMLNGTPQQARFKLTLPYKLK